MTLGIRGRAYLCEQNSIKRSSITTFFPLSIWLCYDYREKLTLLFPFVSAAVLLLLPDTDQSVRNDFAMTG